MSLPQAILVPQNTALVLPVLEGVADDFEDGREVLEFVAERGMYPILQEAFATEGYSLWRRLTPGYAARKRVKYGDRLIGQASGAYMRSLTKKGATGNIHLGIGHDTLLIGSSLTQARYFNKDRPIEFKEASIERMSELAEESMRERIEKRGIETR